LKIRGELDAAFYEQGFTQQTDLFEKQDLAERLTFLFANLEHGTVSILDGRWGTGKTVFAKLWVHHLKQSGIGAIYFDAFASDYMADPFQAVSAVFVRAAVDAKRTNTAVYKRFLSNAARAARKIGVTAAKVGAKVVTFGVIGAAEIELLTEIKDDLAAAAGDISEDAAKKLLEEQASSEATFEALRKSIAELPDLLAPPPSEGGAAPVLLIIIDELDRCRPDFALGVLETLKHFFRADRVHFVLVTNRQYLIRSVEKRYGLAEGSSEYIQKYYDFVIHFEMKRASHVGSDGAVHGRHLLSQLLPSNVPHVDRSEVEDYLAAIAIAYDLTLRQVEGIVTNVVLAYLAIRPSEFRPTAIICFLATVKALRPDIYHAIKLGRFEFEQFRVWTASGQWPSSFNIDRIRKWFQYFSGAKIDETDEDFRNFGGAIARFNFGGTQDVLPYLANSVIDRFGKL
jgi:hypothetical protein